MVASDASPANGGGQADQPYRDFGARVRRARLRVGLTGEQLGARIGSGKAHISRIESGHYMPRSATLTQLADALNTSVAELIGEEPPRPTTEERVAGLIQQAVAAASGVPVPLVGAVPADSLRMTAVDEPFLAGERVYVPEDVIRAARNPFAVTVAGDCLRGLGIYEGDVVILDHDPGRYPRPRDLVLVRYGDEMSLKRWTRGAQPGQVTLLDGDDQPVVTLDGSRLDVLGFYLWFRPVAPR